MTQSFILKFHPAIRATISRSRLNVARRRTMALSLTRRGSESLCWPIQVRLPPDDWADDML